jgi:hypothetical protein
VIQATSQSLPEYENPPINEVVCGLLFKRLDGLLNPYLGILWEKYKPEYAECREVAPLLPVIETFDQPSQSESQYVDVLPLPRTWFVHVDGNGVIQVQRDRFLHNISIEFFVHGTLILAWSLRKPSRSCFKPVKNTSNDSKTKR